MQLWLYLHFHALQLDSLFAAEHKQPVIIVGGHKNTVMQLNQSAKEQGIKVGMGLGSASALCHELHVHAYEMQVEKRRLTEVANWLYLVTSDICFFEPNGLMLRISNMLSLYGGLTAYWEHLQRHMQSLQLGYSFAVANSPLAARILARAESNQLFSTVSACQQAVEALPVDKSDLPDNVIEKLLRLGIKTHHDLLAFPMGELARRFDLVLVNYVGRLSGQFKYPLDFYHPPQGFERELTLLFEIENVQWLEKPLNKLLLQLQAFLNSSNKLAYELQLQLQLRDHAAVQLTLSAAAGEFKADKWLVLFLLRLESVELVAPVTAIVLKVLRMDQKPAQYTDLFDGHCGLQTQAELVSFLQAKLGQQAVQKLVLTDDPRPDLASQYADIVTTSDEEQFKLPAQNNHLIRPTLLLPAPQPLRQKVIILQGPERIVAGWWDKHNIHRDYFVARTLNGQHLWIYRNQKQQWFVQGMFS